MTKKPGQVGHDDRRNKIHTLDGQITLICLTGVAPCNSEGSWSGTLNNRCHHGPFVKELTLQSSTHTIPCRNHLSHLQPTTDGQTEGLIEGKREGRFTQLVPIWYVVREHFSDRPPTMCQFYAKMMQELVSNLESFYHRKARSVKCSVLQGLHFVAL